MPCSTEWRDTLSAWVDGETSATRAHVTEAHVAVCASCRAFVGASRAVGARMRARSLIGPGVEARRSRRTRPIPSAIAAALVAAAAFFFLASRATVSLPEALANDAVGHHVRGFARPEPCDFTSSDPHLVAAWVERTLGYSVDVPELAGMTLLGARKCSLEGVTTAAILYKRGDEALSVFVPKAGSTAAEDAARFGSRIGRCERGPLSTFVCSRSTERQAIVAVAEQESVASMATR